MDSEEAPPSDSPAAAQWPPRAQTPPPPSAVQVELREALRGDGPELPELTLDETVAPEKPHEFQAGRLAQVAASGPRRSAVEPPPPPGAPPKALVFDPKNPSGRNRHDSIFDTQEEDFEARMWELRRDAAMAGVTVSLIPYLTLGQAPLLWWIATASLGAIGGIGARAAGDSCLTWAAVMPFVGIFASFAYSSSPAHFLIPASLMASGWIAGLVRETRR